MSGPDAFEEYVAARRGALLRTAYLLTGTHEDAEDLVQVALVKAVPHWKRIADHPEPYVRKILARESVSRWRRRRWREVHTDRVPDTAV
ncbi:sigma factor, partial [Nocardioides hankookensis]